MGIIDVCLVNFDSIVQIRVKISEAFRRSIYIFDDYTYRNKKHKETSSLSKERDIDL